MKYHLFKATRLYEGEPYCGPTSDYMKAEFSHVRDAREAKSKFQERNPVGWNIWDADTKQLVEGFDYLS